MLYQKLASSISSFNPSSSSPPFPSQLLPLPFASQLKPKENMECFEEKALKTSFWPEKSTQQVLSEDLWVGNGGNTVSGDDFFVDGFFDFSNDDVEEGEGEEEEEEGEEEKGFFSVSSQCLNSNSSRGFSAKDDFGSVPESELSVPADDLESLEWLSHFVDESFSEFPPIYPVGTPLEKTQTPKQNRSEPDMGAPSVRSTGFLTSVPSKARSKRPRTGGRVWSHRSLSFAESSTSSSSSSSSITSPSPHFIFNTRQNHEFFNYYGKPPAKKQKKKPVTETGPTQPQRRCTHCGVQKTPQWRAGPLGAKTLCNACGVRFKSGRLLPEYRPACSPTFSSDVHSNNHRKVLEMRRKKEMAQPEHGFGPAVQSF